MEKAAISKYFFLIISSWPKKEILDAANDNGKTAKHSLLTGSLGEVLACLVISVTNRLSPFS